MADRTTHPHDTSTPAMSAETVPSEEFVLVPREPTKAMARAGEKAYFAIPADRDGPAMEAVIYRAMISAAPTLSASHLAKEGGEAEAVDDFGESGWSAGWNAGYRDGYNEAFAKYGCASLPQHSPALAKGGDAVRLLPCPFCGGEPTLHPHSSDHMLGAWVSCSTCGLESPTETGRSVEAAVQHWNTRAALSTPTEGPASQTEGMGGDAATVEKLRKLAEAAAKVAPGPWEADGEETEGGWGKHDEFVILDAQGRRLCGTENADHTFGSISEENDGDGGHYQWNEPARVLMHFIAACDPMAILSLLAALTPPETAEAVPVAAGEAVKLCVSIEAFLAMHRKGVLTPRTPNIPIELLEKALVVLRSQRDDAVKASETAREEAFEEALKFIASRAHAALAARSASSQGGE